MSQQSTKAKPPKNLLWKYAGLGTQMIVAIGLAIFLGKKIDDWLTLKMPVFIWTFPLLIIIIMLVKVIIDTNRKK